MSIGAPNVLNNLRRKGYKPHRNDKNKASKAQVMACNAHLSGFGDWGMAFEETYSNFGFLKAESKSAY